MRRCPKIARLNALINDREHFIRPVKIGLDSSILLGEPVGPNSPRGALSAKVRSESDFDIFIYL